MYAYKRKQQKQPKTMKDINKNSMFVLLNRIPDFLETLLIEKKKKNIPVFHIF
jgi:hypothetical protein